MNESFYKAVSNKPDFNSIEKEVIEFWKNNDIFKKSIESRQDAEEFIFYEGPPTANGKPGVHHVLARTFKDLVCRYQTMQGKKVKRNAGWDEHGLPVEIEVQKQNSLKSKEDIEQMGIGKFNELCAASTQKYINEWEELTERMAYWVNFDNAYRTSDPKYIERVWGIISKLHESDLLYQGYKVVPWACDSGTVVSQAEVALGYKDVIDETAYVKFQLEEESADRLLQKLNLDKANVFMLAWTTTPWTLPSNMALAVSPKIEYSVCRRKSPSSPTLLPQGEKGATQKLKVNKELEKQLINLAKQFRKDPTKSEDLLWKKLKDRQLEDKKFRRQEPIGQFIVDFFCASDKLVIEVDGEIHESQKEADQARQQLLELTGLRFLRVSSKEVEDNIETVLEKIRDYFKKIEEEANKKHSSSETPLSPCGRGAGGEGHYIILSKKRWKTVLGEEEWEEVTTIQFSEQDKYYYKSLFDGRNKESFLGVQLNNTFVEDDESIGTGIVHIAPAFGQDDFNLHNDLRQSGKDVPEIVCLVNQQGEFTDEAPEFLKGQSLFNEHKKTKDLEFVRINKIICKHLDEKGLIQKTEKYEHSYPHNWRTGNPLIYFLRPSWYVRTQNLREKLLEANNKVNWYPGHVKEGRFGKWLENNVDWSISRERYWGTPLPLWVGEKTGTVKSIGSFEELEKLAGNLPPFQGGNGGFDPHKPTVDEITWEENGETFRRVPEVLDCWFDSGSMPYASEENPRGTADYICEAVDQTRGWFYSLLAITVSLTDAYGKEPAPPYKNVLCLGHILDKDGQKMSKSKGNVVNPWELFEKFGADPVRWYMISACSAGQPIKFDLAGVNEVMRRFILPLWNTYAFYVLYANLDGLTDKQLNAPGELLERQLQPIDLWIVARLSELNRQVSEEYDKFEFSKATQLIEKFVDDLSNVWVRANRSRFWNTTEGSVVDLAAYNTLHVCLIGVCRLFAPFMPLLSDSIYQNLKPEESEESIHLTMWPEPDLNTELENKLIAEMDQALEIVNIGRNLRQELKIKIRQPLGRIFVSKDIDISYFGDFIMNELNIKIIEFTEQEEKVKLDTNLTPALISEGLARELIHAVQNLRKNSGLDVSDRINLYFDFKEESDLLDLLVTQKEYITGEVLALSWNEGQVKNGSTFIKTVKLQGKQIKVAIEKVV